MKDGTRSSVSDTECVCDSSNYWKDIIMSEDSEVEKVEIMYRKSD
jgi:hypothetical protein